MMTLPSSSAAAASRSSSSLRAHEGGIVAVCDASTRTTLLSFGGKLSAVPIVIYGAGTKNLDAVNSVLKDLVHVTRWVLFHHPLARMNDDAITAQHLSSICSSRLSHDTTSTCTTVRTPPVP